MKNFNISGRQTDNVTYLVLSGDLVFGEAINILRHSIRHLLDEGNTKIFLDMKAVGYVDSSGIGELVSGFTAVSRENGQFKLFNLSPRIRQLLAICKLLTIFDTDD